MPRIAFWTTVTAPFLLTLLLTLPLAAQTSRTPVSLMEAGVTDLAEVERREMPRLDPAELQRRSREYDAERRELGAPYVFAEPQAAGFGTADAGTWETLADGARLWRLRIASSGARHVNLGFSQFDLPPGAALWVYNRTADAYHGPYTARHRTASGGLWTPIVYGDEIVVELFVPVSAGGAEAAGEVNLRVGSVNHGFRGFEKNHGACNIDVVCPEGDPWRDQVNSVAAYTIHGFLACTGQMVANTSGDSTPYFLSANHCVEGVFGVDTDSFVFYWNYQAATCGTQHAEDSEQTQTGAEIVARDARADFLLLRLSDDPLPEWDVFFSGWDRSGDNPDASVCIHHPSGHVKSISFNDDPLGTVGINPFTLEIEDDGIDHWEVDNWEQGTTEGGSSGSGLWHGENQLLIGWLTGGFASCAFIDADFYGKMSYGWEVGDSPESQLAPWLDPGGTGDLQREGYYAVNDRCRPTATQHCFNNRRFGASVHWGDEGAEASVVPGGNDLSGTFSFFNGNNWEVLVKVLPGCRQNGYYWVFAAGATSLPWEVTITDSESGEKKVWKASSGPFQVVTDTMAIPCD